MKRSRASLNKCVVFEIKISTKNDEKPNPKVRKTLFVTKIDKKSLPGTPFGAKERFLVEFGRPARSPKNAKSGPSDEKLYLRLTSIPYKIPSRAILGAWTPQVGKKVRAGAPKIGPGVVRNAKNQPIN